MTTEAEASITGESNRWLKKTPRKATARPSKAAVSSKRIVKRLGSLPRWMAVKVPLPFLGLRKARQATLNEK